MNAFAKDHSFYDRVHARQVQRILPGDYLALNGKVDLNTKSEMMMTVLGSCVAVCLTDPETQTAGMNHFMLPDVSRSGLVTASFDSLNPSARYGVHAMELLINKMMQLGASKNRLQAWVFGGARVLSTMSDIGQGNVDFALRYLAIEKIPVIAQNTGGTLPRKLYLDPSVGIPACFPIAKITPTLDRDEKLYADALTRSQPQVATDISLFEEATQ
jgi:chemotaxis protein CheD